MNNTGMNADLNDLAIAAEEIERLSGIDVGEIFVGGVLGGVYRPSVLKNPKRLMLLAITELLVTVIIFVLSIPIGLFLTGHATSGIKDLPAILNFLYITLGITVVAVIAWNLYMRILIQRLRIFMRLLDEVDRYHRILQAVDVLDRLEAVQRSQMNRIDRHEIFEALRMTRDNLISGFLTEKILRDNRGLLARRHDLFMHIEQNLAALQAFEVSHQATEYGQLLHEALHIGMSVYKEVQQFSNSHQSSEH
jgi:hypothetical protein